MDMEVRKKLKNLSRLLDGVSIVSFGGSMSVTHSTDKVLPLVFTAYQSVKTVGYNRTEENVGNNYLVGVYVIIGVVQLAYVLTASVIEKRIEPDKILNTAGFFTGGLSEYLHKLRSEI